jgi:hypothetical protein
MRRKTLAHLPLYAADDATAIVEHVATIVYRCLFSRGRAPVLRANQTVARCLGRADA